jgi:hypothetical protein
MSQRSEPHDSLDDFPTPPWAGRALCEHVIDVGQMETCLEPAAGRGFLCRGLEPTFFRCLQADIHDYGNKIPTEDFLIKPVEHDWDVDWVITNPPFRLGLEFAQRALPLAKKGVALLVRTQFLESKLRYDELFRDRAPDIIAQFVERVPMVKGRVDPNASTATAYCWLVWLQDNPAPYPGPIFQWIPPCRHHLEKPGDYD